MEGTSLNFESVGLSTHLYRHGCASANLIKISGSQRRDSFCCTIHLGENHCDEKVIDEADREFSFKTPFPA